MEVTDNNLLVLSNYLAQTLSPELSVRQPAEKQLLSLERNQNYPVLLLKVIERDSIDMTIRVSASVVFKNYIKRNWKIEENEDKICREDREIIKTHIVNLMLCAPENIQKQLSDAVSIIGKNDFPDNWPGLLDEMKTKFSTGDIGVINGVLRTAHSLFKKYRYEFKSQKLWEEIKFVLDTFAESITNLMVETMKIVQGETSPQMLSTIYNSLLLLCKIFYSLNFQDLPEFFEDNMRTWMEHFHTLLTTSPPSLVSNDDDDPGVIEQVRSQICENIVMYAQKYDEEFGPFLPPFVEDVWNLLVGLGPQPKYDLLICNALQFLSTVAERKQYQHLFENPSVLSSICEKVILPNIQFRTSDEELFEDNPEEYIRRDIEGSDVDTRRKAACDLVKALGKTYEQQISSSFSAYVKSMLDTYATNSANWQCKNAAIFLVTSLAARGQTQRLGVTQISGLVNINDFALQFIIPELQKDNVNELPVIKADCIRYMMTFRSVLPQEMVFGSLPNLVKFLAADSKVIHTYAAACIDKILCAQMSPAVTESIVAIGAPLLNGYFVALSKPGSAENEYVMKAILRTMCVLNDKAIPYLENMLGQLIVKLEAVSKNPGNPHFNHALFETIALCIKIVCSVNPVQVNAFEAALFPVFSIILQQDVLEFVPYVFQLLSMLLEFRVGGEPIPGPYMELYKLLFTPVLWERSGNVHPLVRLLTAYISKMNPSEMPTQLQLMSLLGVFQKLIASKVHDHEGLYLLRVLLEKCPSNLFEPSTKKGIFVTLMQRLTTMKTVKFIKGLTVFLCFYAVHSGVADLVSTLDGLQANLFLSVVEKIFLHENVRDITPVEKKIVAVGLTRIISEAAPLLNGPNPKWWPLTLAQILRILSSSESTDKKDEVILNLPSDGGYEVVYSKLVHASKSLEDPLPSIGNVVEYVTQTLLALNATQPGRITTMISSLSMEEQQMLTNLLSQTNVKL